MDMRVYYRKIQEKENELREESVVVVSVETPDGGKAGILTEVSRRNAARLIVEGRVLLADREETERFRKSVRDAKAQADEKEAVRRLQFTVVSASDKQSGIRLSKA